MFTGNARLISRLFHCFCHGLDNAFIENTGDNVFIAQLIWMNKVCNRIRCCYFHFFIDLFGPDIQAPRKIPGKAKALLIWLGKSERPVAKIRHTLKAS